MEKHLPFSYRHTLNHLHVHARHTETRQGLALAYYASNTDLLTPAGYSSPFESSDYPTRILANTEQLSRLHLRLTPRVK